MRHDKEESRFHLGGSGSSMRHGLRLRSAWVFLATLAMVGIVALLPTLGFALPDPGRGETLAAAHCAACHAIGSEGDSPNPKAPAFRTLSSRYPLDNLQEALAEGGHEGQEMPEFAFSPDDVGDLIAYMKRVSGQR